MKSNMNAPVLKAELTGTAVKLSWTDTSKEKLFRVQRRIGLGLWLTAAMLPRNTTLWSEVITAGVAYEYRVRAEGPHSFSNWSNIATATAPVPSGKQLIYSESFSTGKIPANWMDWGGAGHESWAGTTARFGSLPNLAIGAWFLPGWAHRELFIQLTFQCSGYPTINSFLEIIDLYGVRDGEKRGDEVFDVYIMKDGRIQPSASSTIAKALPVIPLNTAVVLYLHWKAIALGQSFASLAWALPGQPEPTSGTHYSEISNGTYDRPIDEILFGPVSDPVEFSYKDLKIFIPT